MKNLAKGPDETQPEGSRHFWVRGEKPYEAGAQNAIRQSVAACFEDAGAWLPDVALNGWDLGHLDAAQMAPLVTALLCAQTMVRYSISI